MAEEKSHVLTSMPAILTGLAALVTAVGGTYAVLNKPQAAPSVVKEAQGPATSREPQQAPEPAAQVAGAATGAVGPFSARAVVDDPDGFVNVRAGKSSSSRIIAKVRLSEPLRTHPQAGDWWLVRTASGQVGYVHATRIRLVEG
jgi:hypothetical protein